MSSVLQGCDWRHACHRLPEPTLKHCNPSLDVGHPEQSQCHLMFNCVEMLPYSGPVSCQLKQQQQGRMSNAADYQSQQAVSRRIANSRHSFLSCSMHHYARGRREVRHAQHTSHGGASAPCFSPQ